MAEKGSDGIEDELRRKVMHYRAKAESAGNAAALAVASRCVEIVEEVTNFDGVLPIQLAVAYFVSEAIRREFGLPVSEPIDNAAGEEACNV